MNLRKTSEQIQFISIPYAGGNRYSYNKLKPFLRSNLELVPVELPGRGQRIAQPLLSDMEAMVEDMLKEIQKEVKSSYILYGHSMGGSLGNLLIHRMHREKLPLPLFFVITGCACPKYKKYEVLMHQLDPPELQAELKKLGGLPEAILANEELMEFFLPIIRADLQAIETLEYQNHGQHPVPIIAIAGDNEKISDQQLQGWELETDGDFEAHRFVGDHFFILNSFEKIAELVSKKLDAIQQPS